MLTGKFRVRIGGLFATKMILQVQYSVEDPDSEMETYRWRDATFAEALRLPITVAVDG